MAIELGQASKPTRKQMQQKRDLERERRKAQNRANRTGESVRFGNETATGMVSPQAAAAPKPRANRAERQAKRAARQAARKALTPVQRKQKRAIKTGLPKDIIKTGVPKNLRGPKDIQNPRPTPSMKPMPKLTNLDDPGNTRASMFSKGGVATKNAKGHNDYRKSGTTLSSVDNRKKK